MIVDLDFYIKIKKVKVELEVKYFYFINMFFGYLGKEQKYLDLFFGEI